MTLEHAETATAIATGVIALTGVLALAFTVTQLLQARDSDRIRHLLSFVHDFEGEQMVLLRRTVAEKRLKGELFPPEVLRILDFFETIGLLVRRKYLNADDVWNCFSYWMLNVYASFRVDIEEMQRDTSYYEDFTHLIEQLRKIEVKKGYSEDLPSRDELKNYWEFEEKVDGNMGHLMGKRKPRRTRTGMP